MYFVKGVRENVEEMEYERHTHWTRNKPALIEGTVYCKADVKKKERGNFKKVAYWRTPPRDKAPSSGEFLRFWSQSG
jgi:hypothetical protein